MLVAFVPRSGRLSETSATDRDVQLATAVRRATVADAPALAELVNRAYEVEAFFVDGDRTTAAEVAALIERGTFLVLEYDGGLAGAVFVEHRGYFGMLSVAPGMQGYGLGTRLVRIAEAFCEALGCTTMELKIVNVREDLGRWYRSLGYHEVGTAPYVARPVKVPVHFVEMKKQLGSLAAVAA
jgi:ribosomal protein S18 acetylase RimI-like enzyme